MAWSTIPIWKFTLALIVVSVPIWYLERYQISGLVWMYVFIILLGFILANNSGMEQATDFINNIINSKGG